MNSTKEARNMRHNCPKCSNRFEGDTCPDCGTVIETRSSRQAKALSKFGHSEQSGALSDAERNKNKKALIIMLVFCAALILFVLYRNGFIGAGNYDSVIENYLTSICERDFDKYCACLPPMIAAEHDTDRQELGYDKSGYMSELYSDYFAEFGDNMGVTVNIGASKAVEQVYVDLFKSSYSEAYGEELKFSSCLSVQVTAVFMGEKSSDTIGLECYLVKMNRQWYLVGCDYATEEAA